MSISEELIIILKNNIDELEDMEIDENTELISGGFIESFDIIAGRPQAGAVQHGQVHC